MGYRAGTLYKAALGLVAGLLLAISAFLLTGQLETDTAETSMLVATGKLHAFAVGCISRSAAQHWETLYRTGMTTVAEMMLSEQECYRLGGEEFAWYAADNFGSGLGEPYPRLQVGAAALYFPRTHIRTIERPN